MESLSDDVLIRVFQRIDPVERLLLYSVCKRWEKLLPWTWTNVWTLNDKVPYRALRQLIPKCGKYLESIQAAGTHSSSLTDSFIHFVSDHCSKLKHLELKNLELNCFGSFVESVNSLRLLESLSLHLNVAHLNLVELGTPGLFTNLHLKCLRLKVQPYQECIEFAENFARTQVLEELQLLVDEPRANSVSLTPVIFQSYSSLKVLVLSNVYLSKSNFDNFCQRAVNLEVLALLYTSVDDMVNWNPGDMISIGYLRNLKELTLAGCNIVGGDAMFKLISLNCKNLEILRVHASSYGDDDNERPTTEVSILELRNLKKLRILDLTGNGYYYRALFPIRFIHDWSLTVLFSELENLEEVCLCGCSSVKGAFLPMLLKCNPNLRAISLNCCPSVGNCAVEMCIPFLEERRGKCPPLSIFALDTNITMAGIVANENLHNLPLNVSFDPCPTLVAWFSENVQFTSFRSSQLV